MKKLLLIFSLLLTIGGIGFLAFKGFSPSKRRAAVQFGASPRARVVINGQEAGYTPYENDKMSSGEISFRLIPEGMESRVWERSLYLNPGTKTIIDREFSDDAEKESGEIVFLEKITNKDRASLMVISDPNSAAITVDGEMRGLSPLGIDDIGEGEHRIFVSLPDYKSKEVMAKAMNGYRLVAEVKLAREETEIATESGEVAEEEEGEMTEPYVVINDTPTGWLRVRLEPSTSASEAAKINPGEKYRLLDEKAGWYKIAYEEGKEGWISGTYAEKFE